MTDQARLQIRFVLELRSTRTDSIRMGRIVVASCSPFKRDENKVLDTPRSFGGFDSSAGRGISAL
jgi:hypothetical protein